MEREYKFAVWGTQGGGLAQRVATKWIFVEKPDCPGFDVGDEVPELWDMIPANQLARDEDEKAMNVY